MRLKIISAEDVIFDGEVEAVHLPGAEGAFTVLNHHASLISTLVEGEVSFETREGGADHPAIHLHSGVVCVDNNVVSVCLM